MYVTAGFKGSAMSENLFKRSSNYSWMTIDWTADLNSNTLHITGLSSHCQTNIRPDCKFLWLIGASTMATLDKTV